MSSRSGAGSDPGISAAFQHRGTPQGQGRARQLCADPAAEVGVSFTRSRAATSFVWTSRKAFRGGGIGRYGWMPKDISGTALQAVTYIAQGDEDDRNPLLRDLTLLREGARAHGLPEDVTFGFWSRLSTRDNWMGTARSRHVGPVCAENVIPHPRTLCRNGSSRRASIVPASANAPAGAPPTSPYERPRLAWSG